MTSEPMNVATKTSTDGTALEALTDLNAVVVARCPDPCCAVCGAALDIAA